MADWTQSMQQSFEYYTVNPVTWKDVKKIHNVKNSRMSWDLETDTLGSLTIDVDEMVDECYVRVYLITVQNGIKERHPLGTFLVQTPTYTYDGKSISYSLDAYTPLLELKEKQPPIGYSILEGQNIMDIAYRLIRENVRAPIVKTEKERLKFVLEYSNFEPFGFFLIILFNSLAI